MPQNLIFLADKDGLEHLLNIGDRKANFTVLSFPKTHITQYHAAYPTDSLRTQIACCSVRIVEKVNVYKVFGRGRVYEWARNPMIADGFNVDVSRLGQLADS